MTAEDDAQRVALVRELVGSLPRGSSSQAKVLWPGSIQALAELLAVCMLEGERADWIVTGAEALGRDARHSVFRVTAGPPEHESQETWTVEQFSYGGDYTVHAHENSGRPRNGPLPRLLEVLDMAALRPATPGFATVDTPIEEVLPYADGYFAALRQYVPRISSLGAAKVLISWGVSPDV